MKTPEDKLYNAQFIEKFENLELLPAEITHEAHIRLAWIYLSENAFNEALTKIVAGIQKFDTAFAQGKKFHATITFAFMHIIDQRMSAGRDMDWEEFKSNNMDLLQSREEVLLKYYQRSSLFSTNARRTPLQPDKEAF